MLYFLMLLIFCGAHSQAQAAQSCMTTSKKEKDAKLYNALFEAISHNDAQQVQKLLHFKVSKPSRWNWFRTKKPATLFIDYAALGLTPLELAASRGHLEIVQLLLNAGANPNAETRPLTALEWAINENYPKIVKLLIAHNAKINFNEGLPLRSAIIKGNEDVVQMLLDAGANIEGSVGAYAARLAVRKNQPWILLKLLHAGVALPQDEVFKKQVEDTPLFMAAIEEYNKEIEQQKREIGQATAMVFPATPGWQHMAGIIAEYAAPLPVEFDEEKKEAEQRSEANS